MKPLLIRLMGATLFATTGYTAGTDKLPGLPAQPDSFFLDMWEKNNSKAGASSLRPTEYFFTGKPYEVDLGGYIFKYRNYNPALSRWTTVDPSGFPDGVNPSIYSPRVTSEVDPLGLWSTAEYVQHYLVGKSPYAKGEGVNLGAVGNGDEIREMTYGHEATYRELIEQKVYDASYFKKENFTGSGTDTININFQSIVFSLGNSNVRIEYDFIGSGSIDPLDLMTYNYSYTAYLHFFINDEFVDAFDIWDWWDGDQDLIGAPYGMDYDWQTVMVGSGSYE